MRVGGQTLARVATLISSHELSSSFDRALKIESKDHRKTVVLLQQDVVLRSIRDVFLLRMDLLEDAGGAYLVFIVVSLSPYIFKKCAVLLHIRSTRKHVGPYHGRRFNTICAFA